MRWECDREQKGLWTLGSSRLKKENKIRLANQTENEMMCVKLQQDVLLSKVAHSFQLLSSSHGGG